MHTPKRHTLHLLHAGVVGGSYRHAGLKRLKRDGLVQRQHARGRSRAVNHGRAQDFRQHLPHHRLDATGVHGRVGVVERMARAQ